MPRVSVVTALHNKALYVADTVRSVLAQTMTDWEMIVVENGSTDNGPDVVRQFEDRRIKLITSPKIGPGSARNFGLGLATGEWILFLDADDLINPDFLRERISLADQNPGTDLLVGCWEEFSDSRNARARRQPTGFGQRPRVLEQNAIAFAPWALHAAMVRRSRLTPDLRWQEEFDGFPSEDTAFWFPVILDAKIAWTTQAGALYRTGTTDSRNEIKDAERWARAVISIIGHNLAILEGKGREPDSEQCANIARVFESNYRMALARRSRPVAVLALEEATRWLKKYTGFSPSMMARKVFGIRLFNLVRFGTI